MCGIGSQYTRYKQQWLWNSNKSDIIVTDCSSLLVTTSRTCEAVLPACFPKGQTTPIPNWLWPTNGGPDFLWDYNSNQNNCINPTFLTGTTNSNIHYSWCCNWCCNNKYNVKIHHEHSWTTEAIIIASAPPLLWPPIHLSTRQPLGSLGVPVHHRRILQLQHLLHPVLFPVLDVGRLENSSARHMKPIRHHPTSDTENTSPRKNIPGPNID